MSAPPQRPAGHGQDIYATARFSREELAGLSSAKDELKAPITKLQEVDPSKVDLWLRCVPFKPLPLGTKDVVTIGRGDDCDMVLPHESVSRAHALVRKIGAKLVVEDRSSYGTSVNGKRIRTHDLSAGDLLTIGPYCIDVTRTGNTETKKSDTRPLRKTAESAEAMSGRIQKVALDEVLQQIEFYKKSGTLKVWTESLKGMLVVYEGRPMFAELEQEGAADLKDQDALFAMLALKAGEFSFMAKVEAGEMTLQGTMTSLLMEFARQADEG
jgi:hypothetical protein